MRYCWNSVKCIAEDMIYKQISDITISMESTDYLQMPELISTEYKVDLSEDELDCYKDLKINLNLLTQILHHEVQ